MDDERRVVALTFDDGPSANTRRLLEMLAARGVRATFFLQGEHVAADPDAVRAIHAGGHALANHTWSHPHLPELPRAEVDDEVARAADAVAQATGVVTAVFRPPFGELDDEVVAAVAAHGEAVVLWDVDPADWEAGALAERTAQRVVAGVRPGSVVLMHDWQDSTVDAVPAIVDALAADGYAFVTVPELLGERVAPGRVFSHGRPIG
ncbi:polysaccharide deacetylase family protein [Cellulomonas palmilytica]|uniref:polysaccharide deacetylase family protein n=1 Tax=Cellulomonas palmilytica TaxID=2608402 RepID=UPI001F2C782D|nr:polysaccharide deacetylase family protein [Cellulomonas palmilytica]